MTNGSVTDQVVANGLCTGCGLCAGLDGTQNVTMRMASSGHLRPVALGPLSSHATRVLEQSCPGLQVAHAPNLEAPRHKLWGPLVASRVGFATDAPTRRQGSSGGLISAVAIWLLETGQAKFVAQVAASDTDPLRNDLRISRTKQDVISAAGSRYAPSAPLAMLRDLLARGERFVFVGKPCDVAALRQYGRHDPRVGELVVCMLSFMCAGVPSILGTHELIRKLGGEPSDVVKFRYRGDGWPGMARAEMRDGRVLETDYNSSWGQVLNRHLQFRCKICPDGTGEFADIVAADAWYGKDGYPDFAEREGRSLILTRTHHGEELLSRAQAAGAIAFESLDVREIQGMQPYQAHRKMVVAGRWLAAWARLGKVPRYINMGLARASMSAKKVDWLKNAVGTYRRARGEASQ